MKWEIFILILFAGQALAQDESIESEVEDAAEQMDVVDAPETAPVEEAKEESAGLTASELWNSAKDKRFQIEDSLEIEDIVEPKGEYHYAAFSRPNPFLAPDLDLTINPMQIGGTEIPMLNALQNYPLKDLEVKGIWALANGARRAIVMTPRKEGVIVQVDDPISAGKVKEIANDHIVARQFKVLADGTRQFEDITMYLGEAKTDHKGVIRFLPGAEPIFDRGEVEDAEAANSGQTGSLSTNGAMPQTTRGATQNVTTPASNTVPMPSATQVGSASDNSPSTQSN